MSDFIGGKESRTFGAVANAIGMPLNPNSWIKVGDAMNYKEEKDDGGSSTPAAEPSATVATSTDLEQEESRRRLARMSKYFTEPTGVVQGANTGASGVFG